MTGLAHIARSARPMGMNRAFERRLPRLLTIVLAMSPTALVAQTQIKLPKNKYTPQQDVELGREAAAEVRKQYPVIKDERISRYLTTLGDRLVAAAPADLKQSGLRVLVHTREPERDQRLRPAGRSHVREPRDVRRCDVRS